MKRRKENYDSDFLMTVLREATMSKCEMKNPPDFFVSLDIWDDVCREIKSFTNNVDALIELSYGKAKIYGCNVYLAKGAPGRTIKVGRDVEGNTPLRNISEKILLKGVKTMDETKMTACSCKPYNELEATVELMLSEDYKARFVAEYRQTKIRYERLKKFCDRIEAAMTHPGKVDMPNHDCDLSLLREQQNWMGHYLHTLEVRAVVEHIEL